MVLKSCSNYLVDLYKFLFRDIWRILDIKFLNKACIDYGYVVLMHVFHKTWNELVFRAASHGWISWSKILGRVSPSIELLALRCWKWSNCLHSLIEFNFIYKRSIWNFEIWMDCRCVILIQICLSTTDSLDYIYDLVSSDFPWAIELLLKIQFVGLPLSGNIIS